MSGRGSGRDPRAVAVVGAGYVGLPTAATLAHFGHSVVLAERDRARLGALRSGRMPIVEAGLDDLVAGCVSSGKLRFTDSSTEAVRGAQFVFLCVPTPQSPDGSADLSYVEAAAKEIGPHLSPRAIVVNKSTVPVGSATMVEQVIGRSDVSVVSNPEFLREGTAVLDSLHPDRIVVGADDPQAAAMVGELFCDHRGTAHRHRRHDVGDDQVRLQRVLGHQAELRQRPGRAVRGGRRRRRATCCSGSATTSASASSSCARGPGWGGSCLPKDTRALLHTAGEAGYDFSLLAGAIESNEQQLVRVVSKVAEACGAIRGSTLAVWGLTFKANTDDRRDSPSLEICHRLAALGATVQAFDPTVDPETEADDLDGLRLSGDPYEAVIGAQVLVVLTEWDEFRWLDFSRVMATMRQPSIVDARNLLDPAAVRRMGFTYTGIGRR